DQELHRHVVDPLGVFALISVLREHPPLREDIPHRAGKGRELFPVTCGCKLDSVVEREMSLVEGIVRSCKLDWTTSVLPEKFPQAIGGLRGPRSRPFLRGHRFFLSSLEGSGNQPYGRSRSWAPPAHGDEKLHSIVHCHSSRHYCAKGLQFSPAKRTPRT